MQKPDKELLAKWNRKLAASGFEDCERPDGSLKTFTTSAFSKGYYTDPNRRNAKIEYYTLAQHFLHTYKFKNNKERVMWELHSEGISIRNISKEMKRRNFKTYKFQVETVLSKLRDEMRIHVK